MTHIQALIDATGLGATYALIAVGMGLVFGVLRLINFAYGQLIMIAAYMLAFTSSWPSATSVALAILAAVLASLAMERLAFRPLRNADPSTMLVATFALSFLLQNGALLQYTYRQRSGIGDAVGTFATLNRPAVVVGSLYVRGATFLAIGITLGALVVLALLLTRTSIGLQMRAAALDFETARSLGVRADSVITGAVAFAGIVAGLCAIVLTIQAPLVTNTTGRDETIIVLIGVVVGGLYGLASAALGGFTIGFAFSFIGAELPTSGTTPFTSNVYLPSVIFLLVILVLLVRPAGLFAGRANAEPDRI